MLPVNLPGDACKVPASTYAFLEFGRLPRAFQDALDRARVAALQPLGHGADLAGAFLPHGHSQVSRAQARHWSLVSFAVLELLEVAVAGAEVVVGTEAREG